MQAAIIESHGTLEVLKLAETPAPEPGPGEAAVAIQAAALNHLDIWVRKGRPGMSLSFPHVIGSDASGVVAALGPGVEGLAVGDPVVVNPGVHCGRCPDCLRGEQSQCASYGILGLSRPGTFAEQVVTRAENLGPKPAHLDWDAAAALPLAHLTAWRMLMTRARVRPGESVLIHGIGGGVALAALQFAKAAGARAMVTSSSGAKLERAAELGADAAVNYRETGVAAAARDWSGGAGVDVIIDAVGAATWPVNFAAARKGGRIVHCGVTAGAQTEANLAALYWNQLTVMGSTMGSHEDFRLMLAAVAAAGIAPVLDSVRPLGEVRDAMARMEAGEQFGKLALRIGA